MREDEIKTILLNLNASQDCIEASALVSTDGLIIASALAPGLDEDRLGALASAVLSLGDHTAAALACGAMEQVMISGPDRHLLIVQAGPEAVLSTIAGPGVKLGPLLLDASHAASIILPGTGNQAGRILNDPSLETFRHDGGLGADDQKIMASIQSTVLALLPELVSQFYELVLAEPRIALSVAQPIKNLQKIHLAWLQRVFDGDYGPAYILLQRRSDEFKNLRTIPPVFIATSIAFLRGALPPMVIANTSRSDAAAAITATLLRLLDLCQYLTDPKYADVFSPFEQVKKQNAWQNLARQARESAPF